MSIRVRALSVAAGLVLALPALGWGPVSAAHSAQRVSKGSLHLIHPGILTVGSDTTYPPMESRDVHTGKNVGADVDLAKALAHAMGLRGANVVTTNFNTIIPSLQRRNFDVIMSSMNDTPLRRRQIAFVDYMRASEGIVVQKSSSIHGNSYAALCGHSIAVESGTTEFDGVKQANKHCAKKIDVHTYTLDTAAFEAFASGHTVSYSGDLPVCALYVKKHPALRLAGKAFGAGENYGIGVLYRNDALRSALKHAVKSIRHNGQYARILKRWGVTGAGF